MSIFKSKRRLELEKKESKLYCLEQEIEQIKHWCAEDSPEIAFAMLRLQNLDNFHDTLSCFRSKLRSGVFNWDNYVKEGVAND